ncbi:MAG: ribosome biogenesis GTP-binding protein YihA/YsxC [Acidobacteriota bacterium]
MMDAEFVTSAVGASGFPRTGLVEVAVAGRSNVGKSSLINALVRQKVARTSAAPGKTRLANFYRVSREGRPAFHVVDLPGYGYARGGDAARREFETIASAYFRARPPGGVPALAGVLLLVDSRHPGLESDRAAWEWLVQQQVVVRVAATKLDALTQRERVRHVRELERMFEGPVLGVSARTGEGLDPLWKTIDRLLRPRPPETPPPPLPSRPRST